MSEEEKKRILQKREAEIEKRFGSEEEYHETLVKARTRQLHVACYKCKAGCVHLEYESLMLSFSESEFMLLSDVVDQLRTAILHETMQTEDEEFVFQGLM